jgi:hypothetical protein
MYLFNFLMRLLYETVICPQIISIRSCVQCCGTGTEGIVTFSLSGTGTGMHYGSGSVTGFGSGFNIKYRKLKNQN